MTTHSLVYVSLNVTLLHYYGTYMSASAGSREEVGRVCRDGNDLPFECFIEELRGILFALLSFNRIELDRNENSIIVEKFSSSSSIFLCASSLLLPSFRSHCAHGLSLSSFIDHTNDKHRVKMEKAEAVRLK